VQKPADTSAAATADQNATSSTGSNAAVSDQNATAGSASDQSALPQTASPLPLLALLGMGSLGSGLVLRRK
jgi:LPXTG-motif cell wall-anchored protein